MLLWDLFEVNMRKLNSVIYNKLLAQAEEAKDQGHTKLANSIHVCIGAYPENEVTEYEYSQLEEDLKMEMWKAAANVINYYGVESVDAEKMDEALTACANKMLTELEQVLGIENKFGPFEPKVLGQK